MNDLIITGPSDAPVYLLAHGAGANCESAFLTQIAQLLDERRIRTVRFDFSFMASRRVSGRRRPPPKAELLVDELLEKIDVAAEIANGAPLFIGGKSMGGRIATLVADRLCSEHRISGCICLGYPFHPPGKPDRLRTDHLQQTSCPMLFVQGTRDALGSRDDVRTYQLSNSIVIKWLDDGDHDLKPRRSSGFTHDMHLTMAADAVATFIREHGQPG